MENIIEVLDPIETKSPEIVVDTVIEITEALKLTPDELLDGRAKIMQLEAVMLQMPQIEIKTTHSFAKGVYMREIFMPKGVTITGKIHKTEHLSILSQGEVSVWTEDGMKRFTASQVIKSYPSMKRVLYAHEDSVWITVHPNVTNETDVEKIEESLIAKSFDEVLEYLEQKKIMGDI